MVYNTESCDTNGTLAFKFTEDVNVAIAYTTKLTMDMLLKLRALFTNTLWLIDLIRFNTSTKPFNKSTNIPFTINKNFGICSSATLNCSKINSMISDLSGSDTSVFPIIKINNGVNNILINVFKVVFFFFLNDFVF